MGEESCGFELNIWEIHCELHLFWGSTWLNYLLSGGSKWVPSLLLGAISQLHCSADGPGCYIVTYVLFIFRSVLICLNRENWNNCGTNTLGLFKLIIFHKDLHKGENGTIWSEWQFPFCDLERGKNIHWSHCEWQPLPHVYQKRPFMQIFMTEGLRCGELLWVWKN